MHIRIKTEVYCLWRLVGIAIEAPAAAGGRSGTSSNYRWSAATLAKDKSAEDDAKFSFCLTPSTILWYKKTQCLRNVYAVFTQCLRSVYAMITQCLRNVCWNTCLFAQCLRSYMFTHVYACLRNVYAVFTQCLRNVYAMFTQRLRRSVFACSMRSSA